MSEENAEIGIGSSTTGKIDLSSDVGAMSPEERKFAIDELSHHKAYTDTSHIHHKRVTDRITQLFEAEYPENPSDANLSSGDRSLARDLRAEGVDQEFIETAPERREEFQAQQDFDRNLRVMQQIHGPDLKNIVADAQAMVASLGIKEGSADMDVLVESGLASDPKFITSLAEIRRTIVDRIGKLQNKR